MNKTDAQAVQQAPTSDKPLTERVQDGKNLFTDAYKSISLLVTVPVHTGKYIGDLVTGLTKYLGLADSNYTKQKPATATA